MTRTEFNRLFAATADNRHEPETLAEVNDRAFALLRWENIDDANIEHLVKRAFDEANNNL